MGCLTTFVLFCVLAIGLGAVIPPMAFLGLVVAPAVGCTVAAFGGANRNAARGGSETAGAIREAAIVAVLYLVPTALVFGGFFYLMFQY
jgi:hypothetical protein